MDDRDAEIAKILWEYFKAVETRWPQAWPTPAPGNILNRTTGFAALMRFLRDAYVSLAEPGQLVPMNDFLDIFMRIDLDDLDLTSLQYKTGSGGEAALYRDFLERSGLAIQN